MGLNYIWEMTSLAFMYLIISHSFDNIVQAFSGCFCQPKRFQLIIAQTLLTPTVHTHTFFSKARLSIGFVSHQRERREQ